MHRSTAIARLECQVSSEDDSQDRMRPTPPDTPTSKRSLRKAASHSQTTPQGESAPPAAEPAEVVDDANALRQHGRMRTKVRAVLYAGTRFQTTVIRDISLGGIGLSGADGLFPGEPVTITLLNGASKSGVVRWWVGGCCGVQFDEPLTSEDPFFTSAARRAGATRA